MLYQSCWNNLVTGLIVPSSLLQFVNSLFQTCSNKFGTSSANTSCQQLVNRLVTTCLQVCSNLCVFTCAAEVKTLNQVDAISVRNFITSVRNLITAPREHARTFLGISPSSHLLIRPDTTLFKRAFEIKDVDCLTFSK